MTDRPNFLLIMTDQQRADHLGCYGNDIVQTPHIDRLASSGTRFDRFYVNNGTCMPNRATLVTGRMPSSTGVITNGQALPVDANTFVATLRAAGYSTGVVGKSHLQTIAGIELSDENYLADKGVRIALQGHMPFYAAAKAVYDTLKYLRDGGNPDALDDRVASGALLDIALKRPEYTRWQGEFLQQ